MSAKLLFALLMLSEAPPLPREADVVVQSSAVRPAIMRILEADNLDIDRLPAVEVAGRMRDIERGAAPADFWAAYQAHVRAWSDYAEARERARRSDPLNIDEAIDGAAIAAARRRINATFDIVEAIAKRHNAWPPRNPTRL